MTTRIYCPLARREVVVQYATSDGLYPVSVISCSAFDDPRAITCGMPCVSGGVQAGAPLEGQKALDRWASDERRVGPAAHGAPCATMRARVPSPSLEGRGPG